MKKVKSNWKWNLFFIIMILLAIPTAFISYWEYDLIEKQKEQYYKLHNEGIIYQPEFNFYQSWVLNNQDKIKEMNDKAMTSLKIILVIVLVYYILRYQRKIRNFIIKENKVLKLARASLLAQNKKRIESNHLNNREVFL